MWLGAVEMILFMATKLFVRDRSLHCPRCGLSDATIAREIGGRGAPEAQSLTSYFNSARSRYGYFWIARGHTSQWSSSHPRIFWSEATTPKEIGGHGAANRPGGDDIVKLRRTLSRKVHSVLKYHFYCAEPHLSPYCR